VPIGDWTINPYGPYIGCMDGSAEYVDKILDWAAAYNISVLLDVHTARGSQNGYDNGGRDWHVYWYENETLGDGFIEFNHWDHLALDWLWDWDHHLNFAHMKWSVD
jgi:glucan 1,3-beta-glucosidase